jgi:peptidoglycan/xylan/chitin deacetylase (PgdA/CDA1 family)
MTSRHQSALKVLMFHGVVRDMPEYAVYPGTRTCLIRERDFESCIRWCALTHKVITLEELPRHLSGEATDPAVLITFDDGLASLVDLAVPVLQKYGVTAVLFVTTGWIDHQVTPAIFRLERDLWDAPPAHLSVRVGDHEFTARVGTRPAVRAALTGLWACCFSRLIPPLSLRSDCVRFDNRPWEPVDGRQERHVWFPAQWDKLASAARSGVIEIGAHGVSHTPWSWLSDDERRHEIGEARERLQHLTGGQVCACSYPHGMYDDAARAEARKHYDWAFTTESRPVNGSPVDALPRFHVPGDRPVIMDAIVRWPWAGRLLRKGVALVGRQ